MMTRRGAAGVAIALALAACGLDIVGLTPESPGLDGGGVDATLDAPSSDAGRADAVADAIADARVEACPTAWTSKFGRCYLALTGLHAEPESKTLCAEAGAGLITVRNAEENAFFGEAGAGTDVWLGLEAPPNSMNDAAAFHWLSGDPSLFRGWKEQEPDDNAVCARILPTPPYGWADRACDTAFVAICERDR